MNFRIDRIYMSVLLLLIVTPLSAQYQIESNLITVNLDVEKLIGMKDIAFMELLNSKIENETQSNLSGFNNGQVVLIRIIIYKEEKIVFASAFINKDQLDGLLNSILWHLDKY